MSRRSKKPGGTLHAAVYCRKSTDEGLDGPFSSLDAQREAGESFVASQKGEGWVLTDERFDDGGFSGASMDRPALQRLLKEVEQGKVQAIVVYRLDRLTRSLADLARITELLDRHGCTIISVTEKIDTSTPAGRMYVNVLMTFAQHEREVIASRTRDKAAAARRKGRFTGGTPPLGYRIADGGGQLVMEPQEASVVREVFGLYVEHQALSTTAAALNARGRTTKRHVSKRGTVSGGKPWTKTSLLYVLRNPIYTGRVVFEGETYDGEHEAIIGEATWERVQGLLRRNGRSGGRAVRNRYNALLRGLLWCGPCDSSMVHTTTRRGKRIHRYYNCRSAQLKGRQSCPSASLPATEVEDFVAQRIIAIGKDAELRRQVIESLGPTSRDEERAAIGALERFVPLWQAMSPKEKARVLQLLVERVTYDGERQTLAIGFRPNGVADVEKGAA